MNTPRHERISVYLRALIAAQRRQKSEIAAQLGIPQQTFSRKINGHTPFTVDELDALIPLLGSTWGEVIKATDSPNKPLPPYLARKAEGWLREAKGQEAGE